MRTQSFDNTHTAFLTDSPAKLIMANALPAIVSMMFMASYQIIDGIMVGRRLGSCQPTCRIKDI